eukprot:c24281_g2_i1 orf=2-1018(-)
MGRPVIADAGASLCVTPADARHLSSCLRNTVLNARGSHAVAFMDKIFSVRIRSSIETVDSNTKQKDSGEEQIQFGGLHNGGKASSAAPWNRSATLVRLANSNSYSTSSLNYEAAAKALEFLYSESPSSKIKSEQRSTSSAVKRLDINMPKEMNCMQSRGTTHDAFSRVPNQSFGKNFLSCIKRTTKRDGQKRLDLGMRVSLRRKRLQKSLQLGSQRPASQEQNEVSEGVNIWSVKADTLIREYGVSFSLIVGGWENLSRDLLSPKEENWLATAMKLMKQVQKFRSRLREQLGRDPSEEEWAKAAKMDIPNLGRSITVGKAARNKFLQLNLRMVLSQACK